MEFFRDVNIDWLGKKWYFLAFSLIFSVAGVLSLLEAIKNTGKLTEATERVGMPYRQAWGLITEWSERMGQPKLLMDVAGAPMEVRLDLINAFDSVYQIRNGTGIGVFAPQYGPRRGVFFGVTKDF